MRYELRLPTIDPETNKKISELIIPVAKSIIGYPMLFYRNDNICTNYRQWRAFLILNSSHFYNEDGVRIGVEWFLVLCRNKKHLHIPEEYFQDYDYEQQGYLIHR